MGSVRGKFIRGGAILGVGQLVSQTCSLGRNIIIARLVSPADFGIAAIFVLVVSSLEMMSNLSIDRQLIQAPDGNSVRFQQTAHLLQAVRGVIVSVVLLLLARPITVLFGIPDTYPALCLLASIPLLNGFCHLDPRRVERDMRFWPNTSIEVSSQVLLLILAWPVAKWLGDYRAMLFLLIIKISVTTLGSHFIAERRYRWAVDGAYIKRFIVFGWPLLVNGVLLFVILEGDKLAIGSAKTLFEASYTMTDVGFYSSAFMIAQAASMLFVKMLSPLMLPVLSRVADDQKRFRENYEVLLQIVAYICVVLSLMLVVSGPSLLILFFGEKYHSAGQYVPWLALMWMVRIMRSVPTQAAIAKSKTKIIMMSNLVRMGSFPLMVSLVAMGRSLSLVAMAGLAGEIAALMANIKLNDKHSVASLSSSGAPLVAVLLCSGITVAVYFFKMHGFDIYSEVAVISFVALLYSVVLFTAFPWFRRTAMDRMEKIVMRSKSCQARRSGNVC